MTRDLSSCALKKVTSPNGRYISFTYDASNRIISATDNIGRVVNYAYDGSGRLAAVADASAATCAAQNMSLNTTTGLPNWATVCPATNYTYNAQNQMFTIQYARGIVYLTNQYDSSGRVYQQTQADGGVYQFSWTGTGNTSN